MRQQKKKIWWRVIIIMEHNKKIGIVKKVLKLNKDYEKLPRSDLQGIVMTIATSTIPDNRMLQSEVENRILEIIDTTAG